MIREKEQKAVSGYAALAILLLVLSASIYGFVQGVMQQDKGTIVGSIVAFVVSVVMLAGLFVVDPNEGRVLQLFGSYVGTVKQPGLRFANPFYSKRRLSLRVRNFESAHLKVNDIEGNPIELAAVVVWRVVDTAEACFEVDNYENYVHVQSEAALRNLATGYPYDAHTEGEVAISSHTAEVSAQLRVEIHDRLQKAGVEVIETRVSHLAYAPEIAAAMLRRQQAAAVVAARRTIVEGAVGMVENALEMLAERKVIELDGERRAAMVSNLLVVLCSEQNTQPVVNAGSLYH